MGFEKNVVTEFNAGFSSLERLHNTLEDCNQYKRLCFHNGYNYEMLKKYRFSVDTVFLEVSPKLNDTEDRAIEKLFSLLKKMRNVMEEEKGEDGSFININKNMFHKYYSIVRFIEKKLRRLADQKGMLIPNKKGVHDIISGMD